MPDSSASHSQAFFSRDDEEKGLRRVLSRIFKERELIVRSDGQVHFLRIGPRVQMATAGLLIAGTVWAATAVPVTMFQGQAITTNNAQILEAKLAYEDLIAEISGYQKTVGEVSATLRESRAVLEAQIAETDTAAAAPRKVLTGHLAQLDAALAGIAQDGEDLDVMVAKIRSDLAASEDGRTLVARARARLKERAEGLEISLSSVISENEQIVARNDVLATDLDTTTTERDNLLDQRAALRKQVASLHAQVVVLETKRSELTQDKQELTANLEAERADNVALTADRDGLQEQVAALDTELQLKQVEQDALQADLRDVASNLQGVIGDVTELENSRLPLRAQIDGLLAELNNQEAAQELVLQRTAERAANSVDEMEKVILMTGLDVDRLLTRVQTSNLGQGGPFVAAGAGVQASDDLGKTVLNLDSKMNRWEALTEILRVLPLTLPVDYYHMTSDFGPRTDPVNMRRSNHNGVDMAGWSKSSIWAAAPGTVVYSGPRGRYGIVVEIDHGLGIRTRYAHLNRALVKVGEVVGHRQRIALLGSTGRSTGPHLHYEVSVNGKQVDPMNFIKAGRYVFKNG